MMKALVLLSGGLDSVVSMYLAREEADLILAITFDYGQKARHKEIEQALYTSTQIGVPHQVVTLPFMKAVISGLNEDFTLNPTASPWVPNRNGVFLNIGACLAENLGAGLVVCGFNREEALDFPDNSREYIMKTNESLYYSTQNHVTIKSFVQDDNKTEIVKKAQALGLDFKSLWSCYLGGEQPCLTCPSCCRNMEAYLKAGVDYY